MASNENCQNWRKKENRHVAESKSDGEKSRIGINGNWRIGRNENWRVGRDENWRTGKNGNWITKTESNLKTRSDENWRKEGKSESSRIEEEYSEKQIHGCWRIICEKGKEYEEVWKSVMELHNEQPRPFGSVRPRRWDYKNFLFTDVIECYTSPASDKNQIKNAAEAIRKKVFFPFIMQYFEAPLPNKFQKYMYTPEGEFYEIESNLWKIAFIGDNSKDEFSNEISIVEKSSFKEIKSDSSRNIEAHDISSPHSIEGDEKLVLPSQETDEDYIYFPPTKEAREKMIDASCGKWMIYTGFNMSKHDDIWTALKTLYKKGIIVGLKASTAVITEAEQYMGGGVIHCYTANSDDIKEVKKIVDAIRKVLIYNYILYYKTNFSSKSGRYAKEGCRSVSKYMDTVKGTFYKRDQYGRFTLVKF